MAKYRYISEAIKDQQLDFVAVMETGKTKQIWPVCRVEQILSGTVFLLEVGQAAYYLLGLM